MTVPRDQLDWMRDGEVFFLDRVDSLSDEALREPSALPGWTRAHVVSHFSRNARALINLLDWARTGIATPMYPSAAARAEGIEEGTHQSAADLRVEAVEASHALAERAAAMPEEAWDGEIRTALGRATTGAEVPWMRVRETWVHAVDLAAGARIDQFPEPVVVALADEVTSTLGGREGCPSAVLDASDAARSWRIGDEEDAVVLKGTQAALLGWIIGRTGGEGIQCSSGAVPVAPPWL